MATSDVVVGRELQMAHQHEASAHIDTEVARLQSPVGHLVVEGIEVSALVAEPLQGEVVEDVFQNVEEGLFEYLVVSADEMVGEFAVEIALVVLPEQDDVFFVGTIVEHMLLIGHGKAHLVEHVVGMDEQAQGKHDDVDGQ